MANCGFSLSLVNINLIQIWHLNFSMHLNRCTFNLNAFLYVYYFLFVHMSFTGICILCDIHFLLNVYVKHLLYERCYKNMIIIIINKQTPVLR